MLMYSVDTFPVFVKSVRMCTLRNNMTLVLLLQFMTFFLLTSFLKELCWFHPYVDAFGLHVSSSLCYLLFKCILRNNLLLCTSTVYNVFCLFTFVSERAVLIPSLCWCIWSTCVLQSLLSVRMCTFRDGVTLSTSSFHSLASTVDSIISSGREPSTAS